MTKSVDYHVYPICQALVVLPSFPDFSYSFHLRTRPPKNMDIWQALPNPSAKGMDSWCKSSGRTASIATFQEEKHQDLPKSFSGWWLNQPIWKICSSNWIISPIRGEHKNIWIHHLVLFGFFESQNLGPWDVLLGLSKKPSSKTEGKVGLPKKLRLLIPRIRK